jgi:hypothetical protein
MRVWVYVCKACMGVCGCMDVCNTCVQEQAHANRSKEEEEEEEEDSGVWNTRTTRTLASIH